MQNNDTKSRIEELRVAHAQMQQAIVWINDYEEQLTVAQKRIGQLDAAHLKYEHDTAKSFTDFEGKMQGLLAQVMQDNAELLVIEKAKCVSQQETCIAELDFLHKQYVAELTTSFEEKLGAQVERSNLAVYMESKTRAKLLSLTATESLVDLWSDDANGAGPSLQSIHAFLDGGDGAPLSCNDNTRLFNEASFSDGSAYAHEPVEDASGLGFFEDQITTHAASPPMACSPNGSLLPVCAFEVQAEMYPNSTKTAAGNTGGRSIEKERAPGQPNASKSAKHLSDQQSGVQARMQLGTPGCASVPVNPGWKPVPRKLRHCVGLSRYPNMLTFWNLTLAMMFRALHVPRRRSGYRQIREKLLHVARQNLQHEKKRRRNSSLRSQVRRWRRRHQCQGALHQERPYRAHSSAPG
jgi:hypothetical protein